MVKKANALDVMDALRTVEKEQQELIVVLGQEEKQLEEELKECKVARLPVPAQFHSLPHIAVCSLVQQSVDDDEELNMIEEGIPESVVQLPCPDDELRVTILQEFLIIVHRYRETLVELDTNYLPTFRYDTPIAGSLFFSDSDLSQCGK